LRFGGRSTLKKRASDGNRRPVLTSETTKRKVSNQFSLIDQNNFTYSVGGDAVQMIKHLIFSDLFKKSVKRITQDWTW
jgi:hypothetical protein